MNTSHTSSHTTLKEFMFTTENIENINNLYKKRTITNDNRAKHEGIAKKEVMSPTKVMIKKEENFTPLQKDKLFWCFYIILKGIDDYEMNKNTAFATEKKFKIDTVEKLRFMKDKIKELKIKRNDIEDELANKDCITTKSLQVLCLMYKISIIYISGKKYSEFLFAEDDKITGIIVQGQEKNDLSVKNTIDLDYISTVRKSYWFIENMQKPLNAPSAYTIKDLQDISTKLGINLVSNLGKNKTKQLLYEEILTYM